MATERYHPLVAVDLRDACSHYDAIAGSLGNRFRRNVQIKIQKIIERPESCLRLSALSKLIVVSRCLCFGLDRRFPNGPFTNNGRLAQGLGRPEG